MNFRRPIVDTSREPVLDRLPPRKRFTEGLTGKRSLRRKVERALGDANPAHAVGQPGRAQADLGQLVTLARLPEHRIERNPAILYGDLTVTAG
jgi:hypothetical protein